MRRLAEGDSDALALLFKRYAGAVYSLAYRMLNDREGAEELLNEAFVRVWRQAQSFDARRGKVKVNPIAAWKTSTTNMSRSGSIQMDVPV